MTVRRDKRRDNRYFIDIVYTRPDASQIRIRKVAPVQNRRAAEQYEREVRNALATGEYGKEKEQKTIPTLKEYAEEVMATYAMLNNKLSERRAKRFNLDNHLLPAFGKKRLNEITVKDIRWYQAEKVKSGLKRKTVNNHMMTLSRILTLAAEEGIIDSVPKFKHLKVEKPPFDFLDFEEAERLIAASHGEWRTMIIVALKTGLRLGELLGLRWEDIDLVRMRLTVNQNAVYNEISTPKSGKSREIPLCDDVLAALKSNRHLKTLVFCKPSGKIWQTKDTYAPLHFACAKAGIRKVGWHVLRHTFASHLVMKGAPLKSVQEFLGHSTMEMTMRYAHLSPMPIT